MSLGIVWIPIEPKRKGIGLNYIITLVNPKAIFTRTKKRADNLAKALNKNNQNLDAKILFDASNPLKQRIELLSKNGIIGFCLVLLFYKSYHCLSLNQKHQLF